MAATPTTGREPQDLAPPVDWMGRYAVFWRSRFADLRNLLQEIDP
jgi:hypothetical protein